MYPLCICSPVSRTAPRFFFSFFFFLFSFVVYGGAKEGHPGCCVITRANQPTNQPTGPSRYSIYTLGGMPRQETLRPIAVRRSNGHQWRRGYSADVCGCGCGAAAVVIAEGGSSHTVSTVDICICTTRRSRSRSELDGNGASSELTPLHLSTPFFFPFFFFRLSDVHIQKSGASPSLYYEL